MHVYIYIYRVNPSRGRNAFHPQHQCAALSSLTATLHRWYLQVFIYIYLIRGWCESPGLVRVLKREEGGCLVERPKRPPTLTADAREKLCAGWLLYFSGEIYMYACIYIYIDRYVCMYVYIYIYMCVCACIYGCMYLCVLVCLCMYACMYLFML